MVDNSWLTQEYLYAIGYKKLSDDGQYGKYVNEWPKVVSRTYGVLPSGYRKLTFNRDPKHGVFLEIGADWDTRFSIRNALIINEQEFITLLNVSI
jgi:hypothetical protein